MSSYGAIIFDLDNTLYNEIDYFLDIFGKYELTAPYINKIRKIFHYAMREESTDIFGDVLKYLNVYCKSAQNDLFNLYMYSNSKISLDDETRNSLKLISTCGFKIGILTNGVVKAQKNKVRCLDLSDFIDVIVYARECGNEKPDTKAFEAISNKLEVNMQKCLFVGDHILNDVKGALDAGMQAIHLTKYCGNVESYPGVIQMRTLSEVVKSIQS